MRRGSAGISQDRISVAGCASSCSRRSFWSAAALVRPGDLGALPGQRSIAPTPSSPTSELATPDVTCSPPTLPPAAVRPACGRAASRSINWRVGALRRPSGQRRPRLNPRPHATYRKRKVCVDRAGLQSPSRARFSRQPNQFALDRRQAKQPGLHQNRRRCVRLDGVLRSPSSQPPKLTRRTDDATSDSRSPTMRASTWSDAGVRYCRYARIGAPLRRAGRRRPPVSPTIPRSPAGTAAIRRWRYVRPANGCSRQAIPVASGVRGRCDGA